MAIPFAVAAVTARDQLVHLVGLLALDGGGVLLTLALVQVLQHGHVPRRHEVALHGRRHRRPGFGQGPAGADQRPGRQFGTLPVHQESDAVGGDDILVMGAASRFGHLGRGHVEVGPQQVGPRHALLRPAGPEHRLEGEVITFHGATNMARAARLWEMGATVAASWRRKWSMAAFNWTARSTTGLVPFT